MSYIVVAWRLPMVPQRSPWSIVSTDWAITNTEVWYYIFCFDFRAVGDFTGLVTVNFGIPTSVFVNVGAFSLVSQSIVQLSTDLVFVSIIPHAFGFSLPLLSMLDWYLSRLLGKGLCLSRSMVFDNIACRVCCQYVPSLSVVCPIFLVWPKLDD